MIAWILIPVGILMVVYAEKVGRLTGSIPFAEKIFGIGGTYPFLKLVGLAITILTFQRRFRLLHG